MTEPVLPIPFSSLPAFFGRDFPKQARALMDAGHVLAYELEAGASTSGYNAYSGVRIAVRCPRTHTLIWLTTVEQIAAMEPTISGLVLAALAVQMAYQQVWNPSAMHDAWNTDQYCNDDGSAYYTLTILPDGYTIGISDADQTMECEIADLFEGLENDDTDAIQEFNTAKFLTIAFPVPSNSAHATIEACQRAGRVYDQWVRVYPDWTQDDEPLPFVPPTPEMVQAGIKDHPNWPA